MNKGVLTALVIAVVVALGVGGLGFLNPNNTNNSATSSSKSSTSSQVSSQSSSTGASGTELAKLTMSLVELHNTKEDCYLVVEDVVYDVTSYISKHPGGSGRIIPFCGKDATQAFKTQGGEGTHSNRATTELKGLELGALVK